MFKMRQDLHFIWRRDLYIIILYRVYSSGSELLVWYGESYAEHLGINLDGTTMTEPITSINGGE